MKKDYFPDVLSLQRAWALNYKVQIGLKGTSLGLSAEEILVQQALCDAIIAKIDAAITAMNAAKALNKEKMNSIQSSMNILRPKIKAFKTLDACTDEVAIELGVVGEDIVVDYNTVKTIVTLLKIAQGIDIKFTLQHCTGGYIYSKRGSETEFSFLKYITHPHTVDTRSNLGNAAAEHRQYYVVLVVNDQIVGIASDIVSISA